MLDEILNDRCIQFVADFLAVPLRVDEARIAKDCEVTRDGWPARLKLPGNLT
jgi:hypothetical protein